MKTPYPDYEDIQRKSRRIAVVNLKWAAQETCGPKRKEAA